MAIHSSILAWRIPRTGTWWATVHGDRQESDTSETDLTLQVREEMEVCSGPRPQPPLYCVCSCLPLATPWHVVHPHWSQQATLSSGDSLGPSHLVPSTLLIRPLSQASSSLSLPSYWPQREEHCPDSSHLRCPFLGHLQVFGQRTDSLPRATRHGQRQGCAI